MVPSVFRFWGAQPGWDAAWPWLLGILAVAYLLGSIPFGLLVGKVMGLGDVRKIGSGNIGATNVLRTGNKKAALLTLLLDGGKGAVAVLVARYLYGDTAAQAAALGVFLGHIFPVYLGFRGGKGVATFLGILLAINPFVGLAACATWLATAAVFRMSSLAALVAALSAPLWLWVFDLTTTTGLGVVLAALVWLRHSANIGRILRGKEPRIGKK
ncbi:MAG: glycerol-3-phosphate 1-O-acyltransferase PlsY [Rhodobacteraceae bacterium]|nr:glycerol-3-phosphate 1-O-acyltransferase PlsY [Paracoccaceae bacterium]